MRSGAEVGISRTVRPVQRLFGNMQSQCNEEDKGKEEEWRIVLN